MTLISELMRKRRAKPLHKCKDDEKPEHKGSEEASTGTRCAIRGKKEPKHSPARNGSHWNGHTRLVAFEEVLLLWEKRGKFAGRNRTDPDAGE